MALTDRSEFFGSLHEDGINRVVRHVQRQRPSLFNYATAAFRGNEHLFCERIDADPRVQRAGNPLFTVQQPIPVLGTPASYPVGLNWCLQFTNVEIDFHPNNVIALPPELRRLDQQRFALRLRACFALDCPDEAFFASELPAIESIVTRERDLTRRFDDLAGSDRKDDKNPDRLPPRDDGKKLDPRVPPLGRRLRCFCLEVIAIAHVEWGVIDDPERQWLKVRLDGLELVDIGPEPLESTIECYVRTVLRLGILPRLTVSIESMVLDITKTLRDWGVRIGQRVRLEPARVPADVPNNPAIEQDELRVFVKLVVENN
jgi:hypothetical protein